MRSVTLKALWAHKIRYLLTGVAVVLGVAFMSGTMVLTDTMKAGFDQAFESQNEGADAIVQRADGVDGEFGGNRQRVEAAAVPRIAAVDGVAHAAGVVQGFAQLVRADGTVADDSGMGVTLAANWIADDVLNPFQLVSGHAPMAASEAVLDAGTARREGWTAGDTFTVLSAVGPGRSRWWGPSTYGAIDGLPGSTLIATDDATAQALFAEPGRFDAVLVAAEPGVPATALQDGLDAALAGTDLRTLTADEDTQNKKDELADNLAFIDTFLMAFVYIALFVGMFIIYNTFSIVVAQRVKDLAMLRAIGARRSQVLRSVLVEAILVGLVAAAVGIAAGIGLSFGLRALLSTVGLEIPRGSLVIGTPIIVRSFAVGVLTCVAAAVVPALRAGRVRPIAALRDVGRRPLRHVARPGAGRPGGHRSRCGRLRGRQRRRCPGRHGPDRPRRPDHDHRCVRRRPGAGPADRAPAGCAAGRDRCDRCYARENARRVPKRTATTASALMIGVALVGFITVVAGSTKSSIDARVDRAFGADLVVDSGSWDRGFATSIESDVSAAPGVATVSPMRAGTASVDGATTSINAVDTAAFE